MPSKVTYYALGQYAGVSPIPVSRIVAGKSNVDPETPKKVEKESALCGLNLTKKRQEGRTLAFILPNRDGMHQFHGRILARAEKRLAGTKLIAVQKINPRAIRFISAAMGGTHQEFKGAASDSPLLEKKESREI